MEKSIQEYKKNARKLYQFNNCYIKQKAAFDVETRA